MQSMTFVPSEIKEESTWTCESLTRRSDWIHLIDEEMLRELDQALQSTKAMGIGLGGVDKSNFVLPRLGELLADISRQLESGLGISLLRGIPVESYNNEDLSLIYAGLGSYLGTRVAQSRAGDYIGIVADTGKRLGEARGTKTRDALPFHNDRCDVVGLFCLRKAITGGESYIVSATSIHNELLSRNPALCASLYEPIYHKRTDWESETDKPVYRMPIFSVCKNKFAVRYLRYFIDAAQQLEGTPRLTELQKEGIDEIDALCMDPRFLVAMPFEPGDIQFLNNFVSLHSRAGYRDHEEEGRRRLLLRLWLSVPNSRPLIDAFSSLYGRVGEGELRGGAII